MSILLASDASNCWQKVQGDLKMEGFEQKFVWTIENISKLLQSSENDVHSPVFLLGASGGNYCRFSLTLTQDKVNNIGFYVNLDSMRRDKIVAHFSIFIFGAFESKKCFLDSVGVFEKEGNDQWGVPDCINKETLLSKPRGYVDGDKLVVHCIIQFLNDISNVHTAISGKHRRFIEDFEDLLYHQEEFSDLTLVVSGQTFPVHRNVLAQRCEYFDILLASDNDLNVKRENNNVDIEDIRPDILREVLRFIYSGKVNDLHGIVKELLVASETYYVRDLKILCEGELLKNLCVENAVDNLVVADRHKLASLKMYALNLIGEKSNEIVKTDGYKTLCDPENSRLLGEAFSKIAEVVDELKKLPRRASKKRKHD